MIIVRIIGGLGNQLFQYSAAKALSIKHGVPLLLDIRELGATYKLRKFALEPFRIKYGIASSDQIGRVTKSFFKRKIFLERTFHFDPAFFKANKTVYLNGYFQSEKYFSSISADLRNDLHLKDSAKGRNLEILNKIKSSKNTVSVHIRRTDYITNPVTNATHGVCPLSYYQQAIKNMHDRFENAGFFIFSDDIPWVRENLNIPDTLTFVEGNEEAPHEDLRLMSSCHHHIIANSSFSWWGAWLNNNIEKTVISPAKWFQDSSINTNDLYGESWIRI